MNIGFDLDFVNMVAVALEYDFEVTAWEDDYAIFTDIDTNSIYVRVYWLTEEFMVYTDEGKLTWIDRNIVEMVEMMYLLKYRNWN